MTSFTETIETAGRLENYSDTMEEIPSTHGLPEPLFASPVTGCDDVTFAMQREDSNGFPVEVGPLVRMHQLPTPLRRFRILQHWECVISEVTEDSVWADIRDLTDRSSSDEVVELPVNEFSLADRDLLVPGSVFYWAIGYEQSKGGQRRRVSEIRVRRTPRWSEHVVKQLKADAQVMLERLGGTIQSDATSA